MPRKLSHWLVLVAALSFGTACGTNTSPTPVPETPETPVVPPAHPEVVAPTRVDPPAGAAGAVIADTGFELRGTTAGPYHAGQLGSFGVTLTANGEYHVNEEYPIRITVRAPEGLAFPKTTLERADAAEFTLAKARFEVPFTPSAAGERRVEVQVDFAICTPQNCMPDQRTLALALPIE